MARYERGRHSPRSYPIVISARTAPAIARTAAIKIGNSILFHAAKADIGLKIEYPDENIRFIIRELAHIAVKKATKKIKINAPLAIATSIGDIV